MKRFIKLLILCCFFINTYAHAVSLTTLNGEQIDFASLQGKWVLINYWASWCHPCLDEISELNQFYEQTKGKVALFAVNFDGRSVRHQQRVSQKFAIRYPSLAVDPARQLNLGSIRGVPATFVFNPQGELSDVLYGPQTQESLMKAINPRLP